VRAPPRYRIYLNPSATDSGNARGGGAAISRALIAFPRRPRDKHNTNRRANVIARAPSPGPQGSSRDRRIKEKRAAIGEKKRQSELAL